MKIRVTLPYFFISACLLFAVPKNISAGSMETIEGYFFPETDIKYVQFLTDGHLHKNKPHYGKYDWETLETTHFQIFVYGNKENLYNLYGKTAEETYEEFSAEMDMNKFPEKIRVIIYNSSRDFEETNLMFGMVPKGLGGLTEMVSFKRVVIAFRDSPKGFKRLLRHELTHRYQGEFLKLTLRNFIYRDNAPLWFIEGSAEHMSHTWDERGELVMRDAYLNNYLARISEPSAWYTSLVYKQGEFILHFLAETYKDKGNVISKILEDVTEVTFEEAFQKATGDTLKEFEKKLFQHIEKRYSPLRLKTDITEDAASLGEGILMDALGEFTITRKEENGREKLFLNWTNGSATKSKKLTESGRLKNVDMRGFEVDLSSEFGFQEHGASFVSENKLVYTMDAGGQDVLVIQKFSFNREKRKLKLGKKFKFKFPEIREMQYPVMLNSREVAFVGRKDGVFAELFVADVVYKTAKQLTNAQRTYRGLTYSKNLNSLVTSVENEKTDSYDLALFNLSENTFTLLTETPENEFYATASPDPENDEILFTSDKGLVHNICRYNPSKRTKEVLTDAKIGVFRPKWFGKNGLAFNFLSMGKISVMTAPLPNALAVSTTAAAELTAQTTDYAKSRWEMPEVKKLTAKIPDVKLKTFFDFALSSDKTIAVFAENRNLSMETLGKKESGIRFHIVRASADEILTFNVPDLKKMKDYGAIAILPGTNVLIQKRSVLIENAKTVNNGRNETVQQEVTYRDWYIYDWGSQKLHDVDTEISSVLEGSNRSFTLVSPDGRYIVWADSDKEKIVAYDTVTKEKKKLEKEFYEIQNMEFVSNVKLMVLDKKWKISISAFDLSANTAQIWEKILEPWADRKDKVAIYPVKEGQKTFLILFKKDSDYRVLMLNSEKSKVSQILSGIPLVKNASVEKDELVIQAVNNYGLEQTIRITADGSATFKDKLLPRSKIYSVSKLDLDIYSSASGSGKSVLPRLWEENSGFSRRFKKPSNVPKVMFANAGGAVVFDARGIYYAITAQVFAISELNNRALFTNAFLQKTENGFYGLADIQYYNLETGYSYLLDYWNLDRQQQKLEVGIEKNIFLHEFLNWDVTFKQQQVRNSRPQGVAEWSRANLGTTFSLDTTIWDCQFTQWFCHGPHSGISAFTKTETGIDYKKGFQTLDFNLDARYHLPITQRSGLAFRTIGGRSFGPNPTTFVWGGNGTLRGIPLFSQAGNAYAMQSSELRFPILNAAGAVLSGPLGEAFAPLTLYFDVRGGLYYDVGDMWYTGNTLFDGHHGFKAQESAGYFVNVPTVLGINLRYSKGFYGLKDWNFWFGYNW